VDFENERFGEYFASFQNSNLCVCWLFIFELPPGMTVSAEMSYPLSVATGSTRPKNREQSFEINSFPE